jgi:hypothetical protein
MPRVIITAQVEDAANWEQGFRTHGELFRSEYKENKRNAPRI